MMGVSFFVRIVRLRIAGMSCVIADGTESGDTFKT